MATNPTLKNLYSQFGTGDEKARKALSKVFENPGAYTQPQVKELYTTALRRPTSNNVQYDDRRYFRDIGSDDEDWVSIPGAISTAQNRYDSQLNSLVAGAQSPVIAQQAAKLQATAKRSQEDIAEQLKILSEEKSAISKMTEEYTEMLALEAKAREEALEQDRIRARTGAANRFREGLSPRLQIGSSSSAPRVGGTAQFRRRGVQSTTPTYGGLSQIKSGMVNI